MSVGDVTSDARGSGARFNDGKPPLDLIPLRILAEAWWRHDLTPPQEAAHRALQQLAEWQESGPTRVQVFDPDGYRVGIYAFSWRISRC